MYEYARLTTKTDRQYATITELRLFGKVEGDLTFEEGINKLTALGFRMIAYQLSPWLNDSFLQVAMFERLANDLKKDD